MPQRLESLSHRASSVVPIGVLLLLLLLLRPSNHRAAGRILEDRALGGVEDRCPCSTRQEQGEEQEARVADGAGVAVKSDAAVASHGCRVGDLPGFRRSGVESITRMEDPHDTFDIVEEAT